MSLERRIERLEKSINDNPGMIPEWAISQARSEAEFEKFREAGSKVLGEAILRDNPEAELSTFQKRFHTVEDIEGFAREIGQKFPDRRTYLANRPPMDIEAARRIFHRANS